MAKGSRKRTMTNQEIGLAKAMLAKGMKNDEVHFYFNRADRLISPGRITQIKQGRYGAEAAIASLAELDAFLSEWNGRQLSDSTDGPTSPTDPKTIMAMFGEVSGVWTLLLGETDRAECKQSFRLEPADRFADVIKTIAGFANNKGGYVLFGVNDNTQAVEGLSSNFFANADPADINRTLAGALDPIPHVTKVSVSIGGVTVGVLYVEKHDNAPVIALKNIGGNNVKEGTIYYRYVGETRPIKPGELRQIISAREQRAIAEFSKRMMRVAAGSEATINLDTGKVVGKSGGFMIDKDLLPNLQFIREGDFSEIKGAPALRLIGNVEPVEAAERDRARIIRDNVTPDAVIRNFLLGEAVADPMQYIHAQAHCQRKWLPVWYYAKQAGIPLDIIVEDLRSQVPSHPASRNAVVQRLRRTETAHKVHPGKPTQICAGFARGEIVEPSGAADDLRFANAVMGLLETQPDVERFKPILLSCLDRAQGEDAASGNRRSAIYRAACRLDELLYSKAVA